MLRFLPSRHLIRASAKQMRWGFLPILAAYGIAFFCENPFFSRPPSSISKQASQQAVLLSSSLPATLEPRTCFFPEGPQEKTLTVQTGDTFSKILASLGMTPDQGSAVTTALRTVTNPGKLTVGQEIQVRYVCNQGICTLQELSFSPEMGTEIHVTAQQAGFQARKIKYPLHNRQVAIEGTIQTSLYQDALKQGVDLKIVQGIVRVVGASVDLQRDIQRGDTFKILYKETWDKQRGESRPETFLFVSLTVAGKAHTFYRFKPPGSQSYAVFNAAGQNLKREFLRTPIDGARLSSPFGYRLHPILGYTKKHKGVDFAAPSGTPVMAAGEGIIVRASSYGAYGKYILIRHPNGYHTAYAHLKGYASGIRPGAHVSQGKVIGYVGTTGRSTGPHLHFELIKSGQQINPKSIHKLPTAALQGPALQAFQQYTQKMTQAYLVQLSSQKQTLQG